MRERVLTREMINVHREKWAQVPNLQSTHQITADEVFVRNNSVITWIKMISISVVAMEGQMIPYLKVVNASQQGIFLMQLLVFTSQTLQKK